MILWGVKNFTHGPKWISGVIESIQGPVSYVVQLTNGNLVRRHVDHVRQHVFTYQPEQSRLASDDNPVLVNPPVIPLETHIPEENLPRSSMTPDMVYLPSQQLDTSTPSLRRSTRERKAPTYFSEYVK